MRSALLPPPQARQVRALLARERALRFATAVDGRLSHPSAHRRLRQVQFPRDLPDALAARAYQPDHLSLVLGGELPSLPSFHGPSLHHIGGVHEFGAGSEIASTGICARSADTAS